jgi:hypothetical protein
MKTMSLGQGAARAGRGKRKNGRINRGRKQKRKRLKGMA